MKAIFFSVFLFSNLAFSQKPMTFKQKEAQSVNQTTTTLSSPEKTSTKNQALSNFNFYPAMGTKAVTVTPSLTTLTNSSDFTSSKVSGESAGFITQVKFSTRAANKMVFEGYTDFGTSDVSTTSRNKQTQAVTKTSAKESGVSDFHFVLKSTKSQGAGDVYGGVDIGLSPMSHELGTAIDGNRTTGGHSITPFISYEQMYNRRVVGWKAGLSLLADRSLEERQVGTTKINSTNTGGHTLSLSAFNEWVESKMDLGVSGQIDLVGQSSRDLPNRQSISSSAVQYLTLSLYGDAKMSEKLSLLPSLSIKNLLSPGSATVDSYSALTLGLAARIAL